MKTKTTKHHTARKPRRASLNPAVNIREILLNYNGRYTTCENPQYIIFDDGRLYSCAKGDWKTPSRSADGYLYVCCSNINGRRHARCYIHRLVANAFVSGQQDGFEVHHRDHDKTNNNASNLAWVDHATNIRAYHVYNTARLAEQSEEYVGAQDSYRRAADLYQLSDEDALAAIGGL